MGYDVVIKNGFIVDGTGNPGFYGDVAVKDGKVAKIASSISCEAEKVIDAKGLLVSPGFIDPHVHEELMVLYDGTFEEFLQQGVTTTINGNCGHSVTPGSSRDVYEYMYKNGLISESAVEVYSKNNPDWKDFSGYVEAVKQKGSNINMGFLLGHGTIRWYVMGGAQDRKLTPEEEKKVEKIIREGMEQGAMGISTGLAYIPSRFADTEELIKAASIVHEYDGVYASHIRYYIGTLEAVKEAIEIGEKSGVRVQVSHLTPKAVDSFDEILAARNRGLEIAVDTIPKSTGHCTRKDRMIQFIMALSPELFELGVEGVKAALKTKEGRETILKDTYIFGDDKSKLFIVNTDNPAIENKSVIEIAQMEGKDPDQVLMDLLADDNDNITFWLGGRYRPDFEAAVHPDNIVKNPLVMVGSDTIMGEKYDPFAWYELLRRGAFPHFVNMYLKSGVRIEEIVRRLTSLPAQQFRLRDRGLLTEGKAADISVIDLKNYKYATADEVDYKNPTRVAEGVKYVLVNGQLVLEDGVVKKTLPGQVLLNNK